VTYQCKLDTSDFASCAQSYTTPALADGSHTLIVKATDPEGHEEASPRSYTWVIDTVPPETVIVDHPETPTRIAAGGFSFGATGETSAVTFECKLDQGSYAACSNPFATPALTGGTHTLAVRATDAAGNTDATPATFTWEYVAGSSGCGKTPSLNNSPDTTANFNTITSSGTSRQYILRYPTNYDRTRPYRLVIAYHWYSGSASQVLDCNKESYPCATTKSAFFDLWNLANDSTIFIAPDGLNQAWANTGGQDVVFTDDILDQVKKDLCIDESRVFAHGYQHGGQLSATLGCQRAEVFRGIVVLSGGLPSAAGACTGTTPVAYYGSIGSQESQNLARTAFTHFAEIDGCTSPTFPAPPTGGHTCVSTAGCSSGHPTRWCTFDRGLMATPVDTGASISWQPAEVWSFLSQF
jgi:poly(3-hydroxybutyrate) depolymerase